MCKRKKRKDSVASGTHKRKRKSNCVASNCKRSTCTYDHICTLHECYYCTQAHHGPSLPHPISDVASLLARKSEKHGETSSVASNVSANARAHYCPTPRNNTPTQGYSPTQPKPTKQQWQIISEYAPTDLQYLVLGRTKPLLLMKEKQYSIP